MTNGEIEEVSVSQLVQAVTETESYAFLVGAGTSKPKPAEIPLAGELVEKWQEECYEAAEPDVDFDDWVDEKENGNGVEEDEQYGFWFAERHPTSGQRREEIQDLVEDADPTPGHVILASLMSDGGDQNYVPHTLTTNFDDLLFDSFYLYLEDKPQVVDHGDIASEFKLTRNRPSIVKLHGHYSYSNLRNTDEETIELHSGMEDILRRTVSEHGLVIVGYGGEEESVMNPLLDAELSEYGVYWCARNPENLSADAEKLMKQNQDAHVVPIEGFVPLMLQFARETDDVEPPTRQDLIERAEKRADQWEEVVEERQEAADEEEEEYLDKVQTKSEAFDALENEEFKRAVELFSKLIDAGTNDADVYTGRGYAKNKLGEHKAAIKDFDRAIELDPEFARAYDYRGSVKKELREYEAAIEDFDRAIDLDSEYAPAYNNRGNAKRELARYEAAMEDYDRTIDLAPEEAVPYENRGTTKLELGEYEAAIEDFDRAIDLDREYSSAFGNRAKARILAGDFEEALEDAERTELLTSSQDDSAKSLMLYLVAATLIDIDAEDKEQEYRNLCEEDFITTWNFDQLDSWLESTDLDPDKRERIEEIRDLLREHKEESV